MKAANSKFASFVDEIELRSQDNLKRFYDYCSEKYEVSVTTDESLSAIQDYTANLLKDYIDDDYALILDVGCDNGYTGLSLKKAGFITFHGTDPSVSKLKIALDRNVYTKLYAGILKMDGKLPCEDNTYDGVICVGNMLGYQINLKLAIDEFCRIIKPGGYASFIVHEDTINAREFMETLGNAMFLKKMETRLMEKMFYVNKENGKSGCYCCVIKIMNKLLH